MGDRLSSAQQNYVQDLHFILTRPSEVEVQPPMASNLQGPMPTNLLLMPLLVTEGNPRLPVILPPLSELPMLKGNLAVPAAGNVPIVASVAEHKGPDPALDSGTFLGESAAFPAVCGAPAMGTVPAVPHDWRGPAMAEGQLNAATAIPTGIAPAIIAVPNCFSNLSNSPELYTMVKELHSGSEDAGLFPYALTLGENLLPVSLGWRLMANASLPPADGLICLQEWRDLAVQQAKSLKCSSFLSCRVQLLAAEMNQPQEEPNFMQEVT